MLKQNKINIISFFTVYLSIIITFFSLHMSAAAASRDVTLFHAHNLLHTHNYNLVSFYFKPF